MKVMIAVDGSDCSTVALESVAERAWAEGTEFLVFSVVEPLKPDYAFWHTAYVPLLEETQAEIRQAAQEMVDKNVEFLKTSFPGYPVDGQVVEGGIRDSILDRAREWQADFIVMGSHGRAGLGKYLLGSVAEAVTRRAPCSVEVIRRR